MTTNDERHADEALLARQQPWPDFTTTTAGVFQVSAEHAGAAMAAAQAAGRVTIIQGQYLAPGYTIEIHYFTPTPPAPLTLRQRLQRRLHAAWYRVLDWWPLQWKRRDDDDPDDD